jgi:phosphoenolpyruvate synthase/pyruvate phosphate dikinase
MALSVRECANSAFCLFFVLCSQLLGKEFLTVCALLPRRLLQEAMIREVAEAVMAEQGETVNYRVGTMIEVPRACLVADDIAAHAEFFSFGTNDLTQMTYGYSRDDVNKFLPSYLDKGILPVDPFQVRTPLKRQLARCLSATVQMGREKYVRTTSLCHLRSIRKHKLQTYLYMNEWYLRAVFK